ncbi:nucleotidyltransferase domain-containing protein [Oceanobacillus jeddahense]|uniref:Aminoglycoside adenylyltransferase n=1 Tax=Oceanobacillus jeddahense TaxID=1462527 RepID=A0ABY5JUS0_9BACI|nr:hypothetical protein [Oceanobacillus jeddahense]UUI04020.1 hypothetical protein NP439_04830 [Oceanobacillus jeddahense]
MDLSQINTQAKNQLVILRELQALFEKHKLQMWVKGGWAIDFMLGKVTRPHEDIDLVTWIQYRECLEEELVKAGYKQLFVKEPFCNRQSDFQKDNVDLSIGYITYHSDGSLIMNGLPKWIWCADSLLDENFLLDNITAKVIHPKQLLEEKEVYREIGRPYRQKDEESKKILRSILSKWN